MLGARTTVTPFHHQPEAQHPKPKKSFSYPQAAGRLPHLLGVKRTLSKPTLYRVAFHVLKCA
jgi:hypothetical protein